MLIKIDDEFYNQVSNFRYEKKISSYNIIANFHKFNEFRSFSTLNAHKKIMRLYIIDIF